MSRTHFRLIVLGLILALFCWIFADVIFQDRNFSFRDAGHFYYPLLKLVQDEWEAGRWPLWNPYENGGMPLLGNPASAVLYPPRVVIFQWLPISYASAYKWYILTHVLLCAATAYALARNWKATEFAAGLAAISYAFGAAVMFQYCNVIFLVGSAWVPFGLLATDRMLAAGSWRWGTVLGLVLAMQLLGGDPEAAYVTGGLAALYLMFFDPQFGLGLAAALGLCFILKRFAVVLTELLGIFRLEFNVGRWYRGLVTLIAEMSVADAVLTLSCLATVLSVGWFSWWIRKQRSEVSPTRDEIALRRQRRLGLAIACSAAVGVSAVQWIPTWEFSRITLRAAGGIHHEAYAFWIAPWRLIEMLWPNVTGQFPINTRWIDILNVGDRTWEPSLYAGALTLVLALAACRLRSVPVWQRWMSLTLVLSIWAAAGPAGGVSWYWQMASRAESNAANDTNRDATDSAKATSDHTGPRTELETPAGGLYWLMVQLLPGFGGFRYPAKLMTFAAAALSVLAAAGWDRLFSNDGAKLRQVIAGVAVVCFVFLLIALPARPHLADWFGTTRIAAGAPYYGPLQAVEASWCIVRAVATTAVALAIVFGLSKLSHPRVNRELIAALVLAIVAADIGLANRWLVSTVTQRQLDTVPKVTQIIEAAEAAEESTGPKQPFRIHRVSVWSPPRWFNRVAADQDEEIARWEKDTLQPKYGLLKFEELGRFSYTINEGTFESYDYWWFFAPFYATHPVPRTIVYHPTRGYDMWGAKYFVLPKGASDRDEHRSLRTFLGHSQLIDESEMEADDFQVRRNPSCHPRAWIVHRVIYRTPISGFVKADRMDRMREILYPGFDGLWYEPNLEGSVQDPREVAWIEHPDPGHVASLQPTTRISESDRCQIVRYEPDRVEIDIETASRGVMVLADLFFTGWKVTVDDKPTEMLRANRIMRGVPISAGKHRVVFTYNPLSFRLGALITIFSLTATAGALAFSWLRRRSQTQSPSSDAGTSAENFAI